MRRTGVLLHPTALPGTPACGSLGRAAHAWIDALADQGIGAWQLLPLAPTDGTGSPYSSPSGFALNPWLLDAELLQADGLIEAADREALPCGGNPQRLELHLAQERAFALGRALLQRYPWPGNVRELENALGQRERLFVAMAQTMIVPLIPFLATRFDVAPGMERVRDFLKELVGFFDMNSESGKEMNAVLSEAFNQLMSGLLGQDVGKSAKEGIQGIVDTIAEMFALGSEVTSAENTSSLFAVAGNGPDVARCGAPIDR